ncbi:dihydrodipicolinate synthase family protein [Aeoliella sp. ICT_H6.2]|uniref:Dihydrodipicolinate synthase family protein n=1 Tax=Aeoliella straminimaris TaxID=2954799 RepID=A0A9X2FEC4_9BACT|nr:dihydrodipicolinate synthase family protein [Aeoliella straminimaris]MCO6044271.1 dihydrodipicolinate synthase family protein [Aeoliella straminimaris]
MNDIQEAADIYGLWAAIPMPWTADQQLNEPMLQRNLKRLAEVGCDGIYSTDSDGEFYALELDEFQKFVAAFARFMTPLDCRAQMGVTWTNTRGIIDRIKVCLDHGITTVHVCYPYWMPLAPDDIWHFWNDLAEAAPAARWVHYNTPRGHVVMNGSQYKRLASEFPDQFVGTKLATQNVVELCDVLGTTPHLAHMVTDFVTVPAMLLGARGTYSFWVNTLPEWQRRLVDLCQIGSWEQAMPMQAKMNRWELECIDPLVRRGYLHGIVGKARGAASGFLEDDGYTRSPYHPVPESDTRTLTDQFQQWWRDELAQETWKQASL